MTGPKKYLRTEGGERIDQPDFEHAAEESQLTGLTQLAETFLVGPLASSTYPTSGTTGADQRFYVLSGMKVTYPSPGGSIEVGVGNAILSWEDQGNVENGVILNLTAAKPTTLSGPMAAAGGVHGVYARYSLQDAQAQNRNFWNALAATPAEITRQIFTRRVDAIEITFYPSGTTPGTEWMLLAEIEPTILSAGTQNGITDKRVFYFEGRADASPGSSIPEWGDGPSDRNDDRETYGVTGLRTMVRALQRQLQDIIGSGRWYADPEVLPTSSFIPTTGLSLAQAKMEGFSYLGSNAIRLNNSLAGDLNPANASTYSIGQVALPFNDGYLNKIELGTGHLTDAAEAQQPRIVATQSFYGYRTLMWISVYDSAAPFVSGAETVRIYRSRRLPGSVSEGDNVWELTINAEWNNTTQRWVGAPTIGANAQYMALANSAQSGTFPFPSIANSGLTVCDRLCGAGDTWSHTVGPANWTQQAQIGGGLSAYGNDGLVSSFEELAARMLVTTEQVIAGTYLEAGTKIVNDGLPATNATALGGDIYRTGTPKAWGTIRINNQDLVGPANSAVFIQSPTPASTAGGANGLLGGQGLSSVSWNSPHLRVTLADNYSHANGRSIIEAKFVANSSGTVMPIVFSHLAGDMLQPLDVIAYWVPPYTSVIEFRCPNNTNLAASNYHQAGAVTGWHNLYTTDFTAAMYLQFIVYGEISVV